MQFHTGGHHQRSRLSGYRIRLTPKSVVRVVASGQQSTEPNCARWQIPAGLAPSRQTAPVNQYWQCAHRSGKPPSCWPQAVTTSPRKPTPIGDNANMRPCTEVPGYCACTGCSQATAERPYWRWLGTHPSRVRAAITKSDSDHLFSSELFSLPPHVLTGPLPDPGAFNLNPGGGGGSFKKECIGNFRLWCGRAGARGATDAPEGGAESGPTLPRGTGAHAPRMRPSDTPRKTSTGAIRKRVGRILETHSGGPGFRCAQSTRPYEHRRAHMRNGMGAPDAPTRASHGRNSLLADLVKISPSPPYSPSPPHIRHQQVCHRHYITIDSDDGATHTATSPETEHAEEFPGRFLTMCYEPTGYEGTTQDLRGRAPRARRRYACPGHQSIRARV